MASIGQLVVNLTANTSKFDKGMGQAQTRLKQFKSFAAGALKAGAVAGVAAMGVAAAKTAQQFSKLDTVAKTADKLGIATEKMGGLQLAFEQTGVDAKAGMVAMQRMTRRVSDAANGTGPAVKALNELGLSAANLNTLTPDQMLGRVADAMQGVKNQGDKVRLAFSLFDSEEGILKRHVFFLLPLTVELTGYP